VPTAGTGQNSPRSGASEDQYGEIGEKCSATYELTNEVLVRMSIGFSYDKDCFSYYLAFSEYENHNTREKARSFGFNVTLRTIGEFGSTTDRLE